MFRFEAPDECFLFDSAIINRQRRQRTFESANQINLLLEREGPPRNLLDTPRASSIQEPSDAPQILFTPTGTPDAELSRQVDKLWQIGVLPFQKEQGITRSKRPSSPVDPLPAAH
ncbi:hypothetical protein NQZ68_039417 [Dissostichus eleginoides]|nr:hypothetical protein NQZ68_039415 [Dissostichus eleginoides]KAI9526482.1 hypothetical protein NQZ68_039417 [Dissostichus eleginoides]